MKPKYISRAEAEVKRLRTVQFLDCIDKPIIAARFQGMSVEEYAASKGLELRNPKLNRRSRMASKADMQDTIDEQETYIQELEQKLDQICELSSDQDDEDEEDLDLADADEDE